jgi:hypothetical protein
MRSHCDHISTIDLASLRSVATFSSNLSF